MKRWITLTILTLVGLSAMLFAEREYQAQIHHDNVQTLAQASTDTQNRLQVALTTRLLVVEDLRAFMLAPTSLPDNETFNRFSAGVLDHFPTIHGLAYVDSNRIVRYFYPLEGNQAAIGLDLMTRPAAPFVEKAIQERRTTVNDPTVNVMGSLAVTPRTPLYRGDQLLGLVQGVFDVSAILEEALTGADPRFTLQLLDANGNRFWGVETFSGETQTLPVQVGDNAWTLTVGWQSLPPAPSSFVLSLIWGGGGMLLLSLLFIVNRTWTQTEWLQAAVSDRTATLRESEERFSKAFHASPVPICITTLAEGRFIDANQAYLRMSGFARDELIGRTVPELDMWDDSAARQAFIDELIEKRWFRDLERKFHTRSGEICQTLASYELIELEGVACILALFHDISERVQSEVAIQRYIRQLEALHQASLIFSQLQEIDVVGERVLDTLEKILDYRRGGIALRDPASGDLRLLAHARMGLDEQAYQEELERVRGLFRTGSGVTNWVTKHGKTLRLGDVRSDPRYLDADETIRSELAVPLKVAGRTIGVINVESERLDAFSEADENLLTTLANQAAIAIENARLFTSVRTQREELRSLATRLGQVEEAERRNIARELHDRVGQNLTALSINLNMLRSLSPAEHIENITPFLDDSQKLIERTSGRIRDVMAELRPPELDDYGLSAALRWYVGSFSARNQIEVQAPAGDLQPRPPGQVETALFRIAQEALTNIAKHAQASQATITISQEPGVLRMSISDNGIGFNPLALQPHDDHKRWGLLTLRERAETIGGGLRIESQPGAGTQVIVEVPV